MLRRVLILLVVAIGAATISFAGDVQILCQPALRVFVDGKSAGVSTAKEDGLYLTGVAEGKHTVRVEKDGFQPQTFDIEVEKVPIEVKVGPFAPLPEVSQAAAAPAAQVVPTNGSLTVTSAPQNCVIEVDGKATTKSVPVLRIENLTPGQHTIAFSKEGFDRLSGVITVPPGGEVGVRGDFLAGKLETADKGEGSLRLYSSPDVCTVQILGRTHDKTALVFNLTHLPAGEHRLVIAWRGRQMATNVLIIAGHRTVVTASFIRDEKPFVISYEPQ